MLRRILACLLVACLFVPGASAFASSHERVNIAYAEGQTPVVVVMGQLRLAGVAEGGLLAANAADTRFDDVPALTVTQGQGPLALPQNRTFEHATLVVHEGMLLWRLPEGASAAVDASVAYGMGLAMPEAPLPADEGEAPRSGFLLAAPDLQVDVPWDGGETDLLVLDATVSILDASGRAVAGWDHQRVNEGARMDGSGSEAMDTLFHTRGAFDARLAAEVLGGASASSGRLALGVTPSEDDRFQETVRILEGLGGVFGAEGQEGSPFGGDSPLRQMEPLSGVLNGAILLVQDGEGDEANATAPLESRLGETPFDTAPISLLRARDMEVAWGGGQMRIQGEPQVAISKAGFAVEPIASIGFLPVLSLVLWIVALGAAVVYFVKRPPKADAPLLWRLVSLGVHVVVLLLAFVIWDASFADTFGTSVLTMLKEGGFDMARLGMVFGLQMLPWSVAALFFALPVRIALGVGLRYLGKGKAFKGIAKAGGFAALVAFGPLYALVVLNGVLGLVISAMA